MIRTITDSRFLDHDQCGLSYSHLKSSVQNYSQLCRHRTVTALTIHGSCHHHYKLFTQLLFWGGFTSRLHIRVVNYEIHMIESYSM